jgi:hypothetical protein
MELSKIRGIKTKSRQRSRIQIRGDYIDPNDQYTALLDGPAIVVKQLRAPCDG